MHLFFDTETSGLPRFRRAPAWLLLNWPRAVQLAWVLTDDQGTEIHADCQTIRPGRFRFAAEAIARHGITEEQARAAGEPLHDVMGCFAADLVQAEIVVAHNIQFDLRVVQAEFLRLDWFHRVSWHLDSTGAVQQQAGILRLTAPRSRVRNLFRNRHYRCTMVESTPYCALPRGSGFKWPSLTELHQKLFDSDFAGKHNALADCRACVRCFWELRRRGVL